MSISCSTFIEEISSYLDGELNTARQEEILHHMSVCGGCKAKHDGFKSLGSIFQDIANQDKKQSPDIWAAISNKLPSVCECIQEDLSAYIDEELYASAKEGVAIHLENCHACSNKYTELSQFSRVLSQGLQVPAGQEMDIWAGVKSRLSEDCLLIKEEISSYIDREVPTIHHRNITSHMLTCMDCRAEFNELVNTGEAIRNHYQPTLPEDFDLWPEIQQKIKVIPITYKKQSGPGVKPQKIYVAAAVVAGLLVSTMTLLMHNPFTTPAVEPMSAESYLVESVLGEPDNNVESVVYENQ